MSDRLRIGDFGCGKAKIMESLGTDRVYSCDHIAINEKVVSCDMVSVPICDGHLDVIVFSLSLMGRNWPEYISEARRCLADNGTLLIAETTKSLNDRLSNLQDILVKEGFEIYKQRGLGVFTFIEATKRSST